MNTQSTSFEIVTTLYPEHICLEFTPNEQQKAWPKEKYSYDKARWNASINLLSLNKVLEWLNELKLGKQLQVWLKDELPSFWEVVNGTVITVGETRIAIIPSDTLIADEFSIPAEWVDIPSWRCDYYLAVQVNSDDGWLRIWGFINYQRLKPKQYDKITRNYLLEREELSEYLSVLWAALKLAIAPKVAVKPLINLTLPDVEKLRKQLSEKSSYSPRLKGNFEQWKAFIGDNTKRRELYRQRTSAPVDLRKWLQNVFEETWQAVEDVLVPPRRVFAASNNEQPNNSEKIADIVPLLQPHHNELTRRQVAGILGKIGGGNYNVSQALTELLHTTQNEETRWEAAINLGKVDPNNQQAAFQKAKLIDLGKQLEKHPIALIVAIMPKTEQKIGVFLKVQPSDEETLLPPGLKLILLSESDEVIREIEAGSHFQGQGKDHLIQIAFSCPAGSSFCVKIMFNETSFTEKFAT